MPVRPACYIPPEPSPFAAYGARLIGRRTLMTLVELACIALFVAGVLACAAAGSVAS